MLWRLYTIYDKKSRSTFGPIMAARTDDEARRHFTTVLADGQTMVGAYPGTSASTTSARSTTAGQN